MTNKPVNRLTVVESVTREGPNSDLPEQVTVRYSVPLAGDDQAYSRVLKLKTAAWTDVDTGWVVDPGMLILKNTGGEPLAVSFLVEDGSGPFAVVFPQDMLRLAVPPGVRYAVRGPATVVVWAFPR